MEILENKEALKSLKSFIILGVIALISINICNLYINTYYKKEFINYQSRTVGAVLSIYPENEDIIIKAVTRGGDKDLEGKGKEILNNYKYNENINSGLFNDTIGIGNKSFYLLNSLIILLVISFSWINYKSHKIIYMKINEIENWVEDLLRNKRGFKIKDIEEGEISRLFISFNKVNEVISESLENIKREKEFLINLLSDISHQLKTPLSSIMLNNELLSKKELNKDMQIKVLSSNERQLIRMQTLVENLLKLAKLDAGAIKFKNEELSIKKSLIGAIGNLREIADSKNVTIKFKDDIDNDFKVLHDKFWIEEAFLNIIKNCIEHSNAGEDVEITITSDSLFTRIIIEDHGEGIFEDEIDFIFNRFFKSRRSKKTDSAGIGLSLAKTIIEAQEEL